MALICNVVSAQDFVEPVTGGFYKLKGDNSSKPWLTNELEGISINVSANESDAAIFERTTNGLRDVVTGKYIGKKGSNVSLVDEEKQITIGEHNNGGKYSVKVQDNYMYNNNTDGIVHESSGWISTIERYWGFDQATDVGTTLGDWSNNYMFKVHGHRGFIYVDEDGNLKGTNQVSTTYDAESDYHHFAIVKYEDKLYLYNIGAKKFVVRNSNGTGQGVALSEYPVYPITLSSASNQSTIYDWVMNINGANVHLSNGGGHTYGIRCADGEDEGTRWAFRLVGSFDPTNVLYIIREYNRQLPVKTVVEGLDSNNPNTHFGCVKTTSESSEILTKLLRGEEDALTVVKYNGLETNTITFTRPYRGFDFQGFYVGEENLGKSFELTEALKNSITEANPLIAKFTATSDVTLFYDDDPFSYRIPAIATTSTGRLIAVSDYRYSLDDIGRYNYGTANPGIDLVIRTSDDNGKTWSEKQTIAAGSRVRGTDDCAYGDAAIAVVGEKVLVMAAAGDVMFGNGSAEAHNRAVRVFSEDNGVTWTKQDISETLFLGDDATIKNGYTSFFGSGRLAVDENYNGTGKARIYGALLLKKASGTGNYVIYTDDLGLTWNILGGSQDPIANQDEPKVEILPSGQILLSVRRGGGRQFNVFTYSDKTTNEGSWNSNVNGCPNGGSNTCNGEPFVVDAKDANGNAVKLLLQSQPKGGSGLYDRRDVTIWYKEITNTSYTSADIAGNWTQGIQVSTQQSAYSAMALQEDGKIAFFFEEAPCYGDDQAKGYCMVYTPLTIETITKGNYFSKGTDLEAATTIDVTLTDAEGNTYKDQLTECKVGEVATKLREKYPFITLGDNVSLTYDGTAYTYSNTLMLPFRVSNNETTVWNNIYFLSNKINQVNYPVYLSASNEGDEFVATCKDNEAGGYGDNSFNTLEHADKISWAAYSVDNGFAFKFKNKLTGKFIQVTSVATGNSKNVKYVDEANATTFELVPQGNNFYAMKANVGGTDGYLCCTSVSYGFATHFERYNHAGGTVTFAEVDDFEKLIAEVNTVLSQIGTSLGKYSVTDANAETAETAKVAMKNSSSVKLNDLIAYKDLLSGATLNMPKAGQYFRVAYDYGGSVGKLYMQGVASSVKGVQFTNETDNASIWVYLDGSLYSYTAGKNLREHVDDRGLHDTKTTAEFSASTRAKGKYNIKLGSWLHANSGNGNYYSDHCDGNSCAEHDLILEEVAMNTSTIGSYKIGTYYANHATIIPDGVTAYIANQSPIMENGTGVITMKKITDGIIPAQTGVVIRGAEGTYTFESSDEQGATKTEGNLMVGYAGVEKSLVTLDKAYATYVLTVQNEKAGFYKKNANFNVYNNKAYLKVPNTQGAVMSIRLRFDNEGTTDIIEVPTEVLNMNGTIYDLSGRRVEKATKGVYIINGKKVIF